MDDSGKALASPARPASARSTGPRPGWTLVLSADVPTWHTVQWVLDLRWQTRSWWANGRAASAATYATTTNRRITVSGRREVPTQAVYGQSRPNRLPGDSGSA